MNPGQSSGCLARILELFGLELSPPPSPQALPYQARRYLLTKAERSFFGVLDQAVGNRYLVFAKVRLADLLQVRTGTEGRQSHQNKIQSKHIDFVLCDPNTVEIVACVELDDASHNRKDRQERDLFVDRALVAAGLPLIRFRAQRTYSVADVRMKISAVQQDPPQASYAPTNTRR
ncbi:MAG: DUF2726 domain-containing protein [Planctomycetota bacterium]